MTTQQINWYDSIKRITEKLVGIASISPDPEGETRCAEEICQQLIKKEASGRVPDLQPELWPTGDGRYTVACLFRGDNPANEGQTIILMSHYDTVGLDEFKAIGSEQIALAPPKLREALPVSLEREGSTQAKPVLDDLHEQWQRGDVWMFGRGCLDMKSGIAAHIAVMRQLWYERSRLAGNLLFLACPDEENESAGILSAIPKLLEWHREKGLHYLGVINTDYTAPRSDDESERYIYTGVVGKLLPSFYILGVPTHVGEPFRGVDAGQIAAELVRRLNLNPELSDRWPKGARQPQEVAVPPMSLKLRDLKSGYNVQTSAEAFVYVNWLTYTLSPGEALEKMRIEAQQALEMVLTDRENQFNRFRGDEPTPKNYVPRVLSFIELCQAVCKWPEKPLDDPFESWLNDLAHSIHTTLERYQPDEWALEAQLANKLDAREISRLMVGRLIQEAKIKGPAIVVFFSPPYYPHIQPQESRLSKAIGNVLDQLDSVSDDRPLKRKFLAAVKTPAQPPIQLRGFYPYISDLSFVRLDDSVQPELEALTNNMPLFGRGYSLDLAAMQELDCPVVNIGPWGKAAHGLYERVHMPYSFEVVPQLIYETIHEALKP